MNKPYSARAVERARVHWQREQEHQANADIEAFHIGRIVWQDVLKHGRAPRNSKALVQAFAKDVGFGKTTAYNRRDLYLGCRSLHHLKQCKLPREYIQEIGRICYDDSLFSKSYLETFLYKPFLNKDHEPAIELLADVGLLCTEWRKRHPQTVMMRDFEAAVEESVRQRKGNGMLEIKLTSPLSPEDQRALEETSISFMELDLEIARRIGKPFSVMSVGRGKTIWSAREPTKEEIEEAGSSRSMIRYRRWKEEFEEAISQATPEERRRQQERVFYGKAEEVLADPTKFLPHSLDIVVTDPPYGDEMYGESKDYLKIEFDSPGSAIVAAELVAKVVQVILRRQLYKERFAWFQFMPLNAVHQFVPPLLKAFAPLNPQYQLLIWDKCSPMRGGTPRLFSHQCEGIAYVTIGRPLSPRDQAGRKVGVHTNILSVKPDRGEDGVYWKPLSILKRLIHLSTGEMHPVGRNQIVLDPFAGSGSTGVAAHEMQKDFRLIESHPRQYAVCRTQILKALHKG